MSRETAIPKERAIAELLDILKEGCPDGDCELCGRPTNGVQNRKLYKMAVRGRNLSICSVCNLLVHRKSEYGLITSSFIKDPLDDYDDDRLAAYLVDRMESRIRASSISANK